MLFGTRLTANIKANVKSATLPPLKVSKLVKRKFKKKSQCDQFRSVKRPKTHPFKMMHALNFLHSTRLESLPLSRRSLLVHTHHMRSVFISYCNVRLVIHTHERGRRTGRWSGRGGATNTNSSWRNMRIITVACAHLEKHRQSSLCCPNVFPLCELPCPVLHTVFTADIADCKSCPRI